MERFPAIEVEVPVEEEQVLSIGLAYNVQGKPISELVVQIAVDRELQLTHASAANSVAIAKAAPNDGEYVVAIDVSGTTIGTVTFAESSISGVVALAEEVFLAPGQVLSLIFPTVVDSAFSDPAITIQANRGAEPGTEPGDVTSFNSRVGVVVAQLGDYGASLIENTSSVPGATVEDALNELSGGAGPEAFRDAMDAYNVLVTLVDGPLIGWSIDVARNYEVVLAGNRTLDDPAGAIEGRSGYIIVTQDGTGSRTLAYSSFFVFESGTPPVLSTAPGAVDVLFYTVIANDMILVRAALDVQ